MYTYIWKLKFFLFFFHSKASSKVSVNSESTTKVFQLQFALIDGEKVPVLDWDKIRDVPPNPEVSRVAEAEGEGGRGVHHQAAPRPHSDAELREAELEVS